MLDFFASAGLLSQIDGSRSPEIVTADLVRLVDTMQMHPA
jgi:hypothetical protein